MTETTDIQREKIEKGNPILDLADSCQLENGIFSLNEASSNGFQEIFKEQEANLKSCFFVPASGSGSRMFSGLYSFLQDANDSIGVEVAKTFVQRIKDLAIYNLLSSEWKERMEGPFELVEFVKYLLSEDGLNLGKLPKGLIPFHTYLEYTTTAFQEHLIQGRKIAGNAAQFHFTIDKRFESEISQEVESLEKLKATEYDCSYSEQNPLTHSTAFDNSLEILRSENGNLVLRPAGHGTLINNLNEIEADVIFIRNIDNIQHQSSANTSLNTRQALAGALLAFQEDVFNILRKVEKGNAFASSMKAFNEKYDMRIPDEMMGNESFVKRYLNRPLRVSGMVRNDGAPGGGPFWVNENGHQTRQIIEKSQISDDPKQVELMERATHFNPVELVCAVKDFQGNKYDLTEYVNSDLYFIVKKTHEGQDIQYIEQPGLWNGGMAHWLTLFYEIESDCFSPVKTVLDLLDPLHQPE